MGGRGPGPGLGMIQLKGRSGMESAMAVNNNNPGNDNPGNDNPGNNNASEQNPVRLTIGALLLRELRGGLPLAE